jgi:hypothetical protein
VNGWSKGTRVLFWCLAVVVACCIGFGVYDNLRKTQIIDVQRQQNYSLSEALSKAQTQLIQNGVKPNTKTPDEITQGVAPAPAAGARGDRGLQGLPGVRGQTGEQGVPGRDGKDGADGKSGAAGSSGPSGASGSDGADSTVPGPVGAQGAAGTQGDPGPQGAAGPAGPAGANGAPGTPGADGRSVSAVQCVMDGVATYAVFYDQTGAEIGRIQEVCVPAS